MICFCLLFKWIYIRLLPPFGTSIYIELIENSILASLIIRNCGLLRGTFLFISVYRWNEGEDWYFISILVRNLRVRGLIRENPIRGGTKWSCLRIHRINTIVFVKFYRDKVWIEEVERNLHEHKRARLKRENMLYRNHTRPRQRVRETTAQRGTRNEACRGGVSTRKPPRSRSPLMHALPLR